MMLEVPVTFSSHYQFTAGEDFVPIQRMMRPQMFFGEFFLDAVPLEILNDGLVEDDETFQVSVMGVTRTRLSSRMNLTVIIRDIDISRKYKW